MARETEIFRGHGLRVIRCDDMGPDDGNPYFVQLTTAPAYTASLACAIGEGELENRGDVHKLTRVQLIALEQVEERLP